MEPEQQIELTPSEDSLEFILDEHFHRIVDLQEQPDSPKIGSATAQLKQAGAALAFFNAGLFSNKFLPAVRLLIASIEGKTDQDSEYRRKCYLQMLQEDPANNQDICLQTLLEVINQNYKHAIYNEHFCEMENTCKKLNDDEIRQVIQATAEAILYIMNKFGTGFMNLFDGVYRRSVEYLERKSDPSGLKEMLDAAHKNVHSADKYKQDEVIIPLDLKVTMDDVPICPSADFNHKAHDKSYIVLPESVYDTEHCESAAGKETGGLGPKYTLEFSGQHFGSSLPILLRRAHGFANFEDRIDKIQCTEERDVVLPDGTKRCIVYHVQEIDPNEKVDIIDKLKRRGYIELSPEERRRALEEP